MASEGMSKGTVAEWLRLRAIVLALGEDPAVQWWRTQFFSAAGLRLLARIYPRTQWPAAVESASVAARTIHDQAIGRGQVYHLFRLPDHIEREIAASSGQAGPLWEELTPALGNKDVLGALLKKVAATGDKPQVGPFCIGKVKDINRSESSKRAAALYAAAFDAGQKVFPYFEAP